jgi:hypothetical protein
MSTSYKRYREYQANRHQFKVEQVAAPIAMMLIIGFLTEYGWVVVGGIVILVMMKLRKKFSVSNKKQVIVEEADKIEEKGHSKIMKTTEQGYLNKNNQRNNGKTNKPGTDFGQWFYEMECMNCGHKYNANGTDIWQRKCPKCQGGRP